MTLLRACLCFLLVVASQLGFASVCESGPRSNFQDADAIFVARVDSVVVSPEQTGEVSVARQFTVLERIKGDLGAISELKATRNEHGVKLHPGTAYLVYTKQDGWLRACSGTVQLEDSEIATSDAVVRARAFAATAQSGGK